MKRNGQPLGSVQKIFPFELAVRIERQIIPHVPELIHGIAQSAGRIVENDLNPFQGALAGFGITHILFLNGNPVGQKLVVGPLDSGHLNAQPGKSGQGIHRSHGAHDRLLTGITGRIDVGDVGTGDIDGRLLTQQGTAGNAQKAADCHGFILSG